MTFKKKRKVLESCWGNIISSSESYVVTMGVRKKKRKQTDEQLKPGIFPVWVLL